VYFKNIRIGDRLNAFREWRESLDRVVEYRQETLAKEIAFRKMKAMNKLKLGMFDPKTRSYRGAQLHDFRRPAASNMNAKGIQEGKAMTVTGHKTNSMYKRYGIEELDSQRDALDAVTV